MNTIDTLLLLLAWALISSYGAAFTWVYSPRFIRSTSALLANMGGRKVGGIWFLRAGKFRFSFCIAK